MPTDRAAGYEYSVKPMHYAYSATAIEDALNAADADGWQIVTVLPYRPDVMGQPVIWEPWAVMRRPRQEGGE